MRLFFAFLLLICLNIACTSDAPVAQSTPEEAAKGLFTALKANDFELAEKYGTASTQESIRDFATNLKMINEEEKAALLAPFKMEISKVTCAEEAGTMQCQICCSTAGEIKIEMVQQEDKWFAQLDLAY